jgi:hypothetical protein
VGSTSFEPEFKGFFDEDTLIVESTTGRAPITIKVPVFMLVAIAFFAV